MYSLTNIYRLLGIEIDAPSVDKIADCYLSDLKKIVKTDGDLKIVLDKLEYMLREDLLSEEEKDLAFYVVSYMA